jgi:hypothetical protein
MFSVHQPQRKEHIVARKSHNTDPEGVEDVTEANTEAEATEAAENGEKPVKAPKEPVPDGPLTTRTGAKALSVKGRVFTAGGEKGDAIKTLLETRPDLTRKEIAAMVGCSQSRVAEVARVLGLQKRVMVPVEQAQAAAAS